MKSKNLNLFVQWFLFFDVTTLGSYDLNNQPENRENFRKNRVEYAKSRVIEKFRAGQCATFAALGHYLPFYIRHAAHCEFDGIWLDLEHRAMEVREVQSLLSMCHQFNIDCMVRAPTLSGYALPIFEDGASGLLMPLIDSPDEAKHIARSVKFPPIGNRGLDGAGLIQIIS